MLQKQEERLNLDIIRSQRHLQKGRELLAQKNYEGALAEFDRALVLTPDNPVVLEAKDQVTQKRKMDSLRQRSEEAAQKVSEGDLESAKRIYQELLTDLPEKSDLKSE